MYIYVWEIFLLAISLLILGNVIRIIVKEDGLDSDNGWHIFQVVMFILLLLPPIISILIRVDWSFFGHRIGG